MLPYQSNVEREVSFPLSCTVELQVTSSCGGVWKFPLELAATMATPDDIITLEARGLSKEAQVGFRLTSMAE